MAVKKVTKKGISTFLTIGKSLETIADLIQSTEEAVAEGPDLEKTVAHTNTSPVVGNIQGTDPTHLSPIARAETKSHTTESEVDKHVRSN